MMSSWQIQQQKRFDIDYGFHFVEPRRPAQSLYGYSLTRGRSGEARQPVADHDKTA